ncbi:MAG: phosphonate ABC transporter ATP-binding protein [Cyanobacteria bacterium P01_H01_bin.58]
MGKTGIVQLDQVSVTYGNQITAVNAVSLTLHQGEFVVVLGASGAGKSTLLRVINYLQPPTRGQIKAQGLGDLAQPAVLRRHRQQTGMIFQNHQLIERRSTLDNVLIGRLAYHSFWRSLWPLPRQDQAIALHCLERVNLIDKALTPVQNLSGGQRQRVGIARALAQQPRLMLADEPIASLDPASAHRVMSLLRDIGKADRMTMLLSLHQVEFAREYSDRIIGLDHGQIMFDGPPGRLQHHHLQAIYAGHSLATVG